MEEELDLRPHLRALLSKWWWILGAGIVFGLIAFVLASARVDNYQASALVAVLEPTQVLQFDPRFENLETRNALLRAYPEIARSDEILQQLLDQVEEAGVMTLPQLRSLLTAEAGNEPRLLYFRATHSDPAIAAALANAWASLFVNTANEIYGVGNGGRLTFYEAQLEDSRIRLEQAGQQLIDFQAENRLDIVTNEITALNALQTGYLTARNTLVMLRDDLAAYQQQVALGTTSASQLSELVTTLSLQARAYSLPVPLPVVLQVDPGDSVEQTPEQQQAYLESLSAGIEDRIAVYDRQLQELEPQILDLQVNKQELLTEVTVLQRDRDLLTETFTALTRKVDEEIITTQDTSSGFHLASRASLPTQPAGASPVLLALIGVVFGMILASLVIIVLAWWRT